MSWHCKSCGELNDDIHSQCWKCKDPALAAFSRVSGMPVLCSTTVELPGREISNSLGIVFGETILGTNILSDMVAGFMDVVGGRSGSYENRLKEGRRIALREMLSEAAELGADAVVGIDVDYETVAQTMLMICVSGTAVCLKPIA